MFDEETLKEIAEDCPDMHMFWNIQLDLLGKASSAEEFHRRLGALIRIIDHLTPEQVVRLAEAAERPWKAKRGAPKNEKMSFQIYMEFIAKPQGGIAPKFTRAEAVRIIAERYRIEPSAAEKRYDNAIKRIESRKK
jgi:hypothetical protein